MVYFKESTFMKYKTVIKTSSISNEALSRCFINLLIFNCVFEERVLMNASVKGEVHPQRSTSFTLRVTPPRMIITSREEIYVYFSTEIRQPVSFEGKDYMLSDIANYSLGYNNVTTGSGKSHRRTNKEALPTVPGIWAVRI